jgi:hypothetical protein
VFNLTLHVEDVWESGVIMSTLKGGARQALRPNRFPYRKEYPVPVVHETE